MKLTNFNIFSQPLLSFLQLKEGRIIISYNLRVSSSSLGMEHTKITTQAFFMVQVLTFLIIAKADSSQYMHEFVKLKNYNILPPPHCSLPLTRTKEKEHSKYNNQLQGNQGNKINLLQYFTHLTK